MVGFPPSLGIKHPAKTPMLPFRHAGFHPDTASPPYQRSGPPPTHTQTITTSGITSPPTTPLPAADLWEPPTRPASPLSRQTADNFEFPSNAAAFSSTISSYEGNGSISLNLFHPWLGIIYISSPGFTSRPGGITAYPSYPYLRPIPPLPATASEPGVHLSEGELLAWPYKPGYVIWITHF